jgi:type I restriction enzyme, S subunit
MNAVQLLAHFDRISEAPDAIPRLRRFILDLAVRGKLVEQDPRDEPASELLKRIEEDVRQRKAAGKYLEPDRYIEIERRTLPFAVPASWRWARLIEIADVFYGFAFESSHFNSTKIGKPLIRIRDIASTDTEAYYDGKFDEAYAVRRGDYLVGMDGDFNLRKWNGPDALLNQRVMRINNWRASLVAEFLVIPFQIILNHLHSSTSQTTVKHLSAKQTNGIYLPLPPLAEQHRIVAKVDELMALCDRLEAAQEERENRRDRLAAASLHHLNNGGDADEFRDQARFYLNHLPRLTTRPEHIQQLRHTILNLAVRGKLIPQDPNDEPASELLRRIQTEKMRLVQKGQIRRHDPLLPIEVDEVPFGIPKNWEWTRLGTACTLITDGAHHTPTYQDKGVPFLSVKDVSGGTIDFSSTRFISQTAHRELCKRCMPEFGDILLTKVGTTGIAVTVDVHEEFSIFVSLALLKFSQSNLDRFYLRHLINSPFVKKQSADNTQGIGNKNLVLRLINQFVIAVPPFAEQHRIVAKVEELLALCDRMELQLTTTQTESRSLLEAALHHSLNA